MIVAKQVADLMTFCRLLMGFLLVLLGAVLGPAGLPFAAWTMIFSWTSDALDGPIARRSKVQYQSWLGEHDLHIDMSVCLGLIIFFIFSGYLNIMMGLVYILIWVGIFWRWGFQRSPGMLFQATPYAYLILLALRGSLPEGVALVGWIIGLVVITWPRFPEEVIPGFLQGMRQLFDRRRF